MKNEEQKEERQSKAEESEARQRHQQIGCFSIGWCKKLKLKLHKTANHRKENIPSSQWELKVQSRKLSKGQGKWVTKSPLIGWESHASFLDQSHNKIVKKNKAILKYFPCSIENWSKQQHNLTSQLTSPKKLLNHNEKNKLPLE